MNMDKIDLVESFKKRFHELGISVKEVLIYSYEIRVVTYNNFIKMHDADALREILDWSLDMIFSYPYDLVFSYKKE